MPQLFSSHEDFYAWFSSPFHSAINNSTDFSYTIIQRLHSILRPFLLRRMKKDVETQLPDKIHHLIFCPLSRRQQFLYDEFLERRYVQTSGDCVSLMNILMQLRKVCNHPDLFEAREVKAPFCGVQLRIKLHPLLLINNQNAGLMIILSDRENLGKIEACEVAYMSGMPWKLGITSIPELKLGMKIPLKPTEFEYNRKRVDIIPVYGLRLHEILKIPSLSSFRTYNALYNKVCKTSKYYKKRAIRGSYIKLMEPRWPQDLISSFGDRLSSLHEILFRFQFIQPKV